MPLWLRSVCQGKHWGVSDQLNLLLLRDVGRLPLIIYLNLVGLFDQKQAATKNETITWVYADWGSPEGVQPMGALTAQHVRGREID
jgi:hypothetical protein